MLGDGITFYFVKCERKEPWGIPTLCLAQHAWTDRICLRPCECHSRFVPRIVSVLITMGLLLDTILRVWLTTWGKWRLFINVLISVRSLTLIKHTVGMSSEWINYKVNNCCCCLLLLLAAAACCCCLLLYSMYSIYSMCCVEVNNRFL